MHRYQSVIEDVGAQRRIQKNKLPRPRPAPLSLYENREVSLLEELDIPLSFLIDLHQHQYDFGGSYCSLPAGMQSKKSNTTNAQLGPPLLNKQRATIAKHI
jgi:hypothetical protein